MTRTIALLLNQSHDLLESEPQTSLALAQEALALCQEQGEDQIRARSLIGIAYSKLFQDQQAQEHLTAVLAMPHLSDQDRQEILRYLPYSYYRSGDFDHCLSFALEALELAQKLGTPGNEARAKNDIASAYWATGSYQLALENYLESYRLNQQQADGWQSAIVLNGLAMTYQALGHTSKAIDFVQQSLQARRESHNRYGEAICLINLGKRYQEINELQESVAHLEQGVAIFAALQDEKMHAYATITLAESYLLQQREDEAEQLLRQVLASKSLTQYNRVAGLFALARLLDQQGHLEQARQHLLEAIQIAEAEGLQKGLAESHHYLASLYERDHLFANALRHFQRYHEYLQVTQGQQAQQRANLLMIQFETEQAKKDSEIYRLKNIELAEMVQELQTLHQQLQERNSTLEYLNAFDPLTKMMNRRSFNKRLQEVFARAKQQHLALTVIMCDVDNFKAINDRFSHHTGDQVLKALGKLMREEEDLVLARYGGEEFAGFAEMPLTKTIDHCERLRRMVEDYAWDTIQPGLAVTISLGLSDDPSLPDYEKMLSAADNQLYRAKNSGKNQLAYRRTDGMGSEGL